MSKSTRDLLIRELLYKSNICKMREKVYFGIISDIRDLPTQNLFICKILRVGSL